MRSILLAGLVVLSACSKPTEITDSPTNVAEAAPTEAASTKAKPDYMDSGKQFAWMERGKDAVRAKLRDPDSAQFRNVEFHAGGGVPMACGEVNANNGFGGKAGYERFIAAGSQITVLESEMASTQDMDEVWNKMCVG